VLLLVLSSTTVVSTKNIGVATSFGQPQREYTNGLHMKSPWEKVTELNGAMQTNTYASDKGEGVQNGAIGSCVNVRLARQATGCANVSIRWQIKPDGAQYLFRNFKGNGAIRDNLVLRNLQKSMNETLATYDPLAIDDEGKSLNMSLSSAKGENVSDIVLGQMRQEIGEWIDVQEVSIPIMNFDPGTQKRTNQLMEQIALTRIAEQSEQTAAAQSRANKALEKDGALDSNVLVSKCLDMLQSAINKDQPLPAGFSCFGGTNAAVAVK
jgi:regulator of protease activity HflC (stomatin/prohibitin superfamily)